MKTIGILGGMSAASTMMYYAELCRITQQSLGGLHSPQLLIRSLDFAPIEALQMSGDWDAAGELLKQEARALERGGAELLILATNTMHKLADTISADLSIPMLHIGDATANAIIENGCKSPGLIATAFTMEQSFYTDRLQAAGLNPIIPNFDERMAIHTIIYSELCKNQVSERSRDLFVEIASSLVERGADSMILGCTEVGMLLNESNVAVRVFDTTLIHCQKAFEASLNEVSA